MDIRVYPLVPNIISKISNTINPQPILAVLPRFDTELVELKEMDFLVIGVGIKDPGNAGTIMRSAQAAGAQGVIFCDNSVDIYNPKLVRASAGALFYLSLVEASSFEETILKIKSLGFFTVASLVDKGIDYTEANLVRKIALVVGNEANGLNDQIAQLNDLCVTIPMKGRTESLNVGMATTVLCFEAARQRRQLGNAHGTY